MNTPSGMEEGILQSSFSPGEQFLLELFWECRQYNILQCWRQRKIHMLSTACSPGSSVYFHLTVTALSTSLRGPQQRCSPGWQICPVQHSSNHIHCLRSKSWRCVVQSDIQTKEFPYGWWNSSTSRQSPKVSRKQKQIFSQSPWARPTVLITYWKRWQNGLTVPDDEHHDTLLINLLTSPYYLISLCMSSFPHKKPRTALYNEDQDPSGFPYLMHIPSLSEKHYHSPLSFYASTYKPNKKSNAWSKSLQLCITELHRGASHPSRSLKSPYALLQDSEPHISEPEV